MATKTWKLGEVCRGGIITAIATDTKVSIIAKDWDYSQGSNRGSNQSNAKEWDRLTLDNSFSYHTLYKYLTWLTTHYYAEEIIKWVESHTKLNYA